MESIIVTTPVSSAREDGRARREARFHLEKECPIVRMMTFAASLVVLSLFVPACSKGSSSPTAPAATTQSITVTGPDRVFIGATETFTATAVMSDGSSRAVTSGWATDAPGVATVEAGTGRVTGVGPGNVTVYIVHDGRQGVKVIRGLPNFQGTWSGSYAVRSCTQSGQMALINACGDTFAVNRVLPTNLNLTQDSDRVQGRFFLGTLGGDTSGPIQTDGRLQLTGAVQGELTIEATWGIESRSPGRIIGGVSLLLRGSGLSGDIRVVADIRDLNRTSNMTPSHALAPVPGPRSLADLLRAVAGR
jgi:hypothetical protein